MNDLAEFLRARLADIEQDIRDSRALTPGELHWSMPDWLDRDYLLADVEAKRRIIDLIALNADGQPLYRDSGAEVWDDVLRLLALPFAGHPHFREEWRR